MASIYVVKAKWHEDTKAGENFIGGWIKGCPPGMHWNGTTFYLMLKSQNDAEAQKQTDDWWSRQLAKEPSSVLKESRAEYVWNKDWVPFWFSHSTFDVGQDDATVLASFEKYVQDVLERNEFNRTNNWDDELPLMGADERMRWKPPCRCDDCKKLGLIRINH